MINIKIITLHSLCNPGSALQAFALQFFFKDKGYNCEIIDYNPYYIYTGKNKIRTIFGKILNFRQAFKREKNFKEFRKKYMRLTKYSYCSKRQLRANPPEADVFITGSDQLWNYSYDCGKDGSYYLDFVKSGYKMSYAVSLGKEDINEEEIRFIKKQTSDFSFISVREKCSKVILEDNGIVPVHYVCDPTMLLPVCSYEKIMKVPNDISEEYVLVYLVESGELLNDVLKKITEKSNLKVVLIGTFLKKCRCDYWFKDIGPQEFLGLIYNAKYIIASSFHAMVFSIVFNKEFYIIPPKENLARIRSLLTELGIENRLIESQIDEKKIKSSFINYDEVNIKMRKFVQYSQNTLLNAIKEIE